MSTPSALLEEEHAHARVDEAQATGPEKAGPLVAAALGVVLACMGCVLAWWGGAWGLGGAMLVAVAMAMLTAAQAPRRGSGPAAEAGPTAARVANATATHRQGTAAGNRVGAEVMVETIVPVWSRQMDVTREAASEGLANLLNAFAEMSGALQTLTDNLGSYTVSAEPGAVDQAVRRESPALDALTAASQRAFNERDAALVCMGQCSEGLQRLDELSKRARELGRHTRLVAFNASIEANRNRTQADGGSQAVAGEARMLSTHMAETADQIHHEVRALLQQMSSTRRHGEVHDTSAEELRLEIDLQARKALTALLGSLGGALQSSSEVHQAGQTLKDQLDAAFVNFQFGDRVSQMLSIVGNDMNNFAQWVAANPRATQTDAAEWLAALEASYTMDEQRSSHHGNVHVQQGSGVEFF